MNLSIKRLVVKMDVILERWADHPARVELDALCVVDFEKILG